MAPLPYLMDALSLSPAMRPHPAMVLFAGPGDDGANLTVGMLCQVSQTPVSGLGYLPPFPVPDGGEMSSGGQWLNGTQGPSGGQPPSGPFAGLRGNPRGLRMEARAPRQAALAVQEPSL